MNKYTLLLFLFIFLASFSKVEAQSLHREIGGSGDTFRRITNDQLIERNNPLEPQVNPLASAYTSYDLMQAKMNSGRLIFRGEVIKPPVEYKQLEGLSEK